MADHIPFVTGKEACRLVQAHYADSALVRMPLDSAAVFIPLLPQGPGRWIDPCVDGMDNVSTRRGRPWFGFMNGFPGFDYVGSPANHERPNKPRVREFVSAVLDRCLEHSPAWITVPLLPAVNGNNRNRINRVLAEAAGEWKTTSGFGGQLICPLVVTHQDQVNGRTGRTPKVSLTASCYQDSQAEGLWAVDKSLQDEVGSPALRNRRFAGVVDLHRELNDRIASEIRVAGPYWGLNLVLWARGLVTHPAIGVGSGYQYYLAGGHASTATARLALAPLRRRAEGGPELRVWLDAAIARLTPAMSAHAEFTAIRTNYAAYSSTDRARTQVATTYKSWFDTLASATGNRSVAAFRDLSNAFALGRFLPDLVNEGAAKRPEAIAESLMLSSI